MRVIKSVVQAPCDLIHTQSNSYPYVITAVTHGYRCFIPL